MYGEQISYFVYFKIILSQILIFIFSTAQQSPSGPGPPHYRSFTITLRHTTLDRTPLDEWSARRRDLYLTTHNTQKRKISIPLAGFEPTILASERRQNHVLDSTATGITHKCNSDYTILCKDKYFIWRRQDLPKHVVSVSERMFTINFVSVSKMYS